MRGKAAVYRQWIVTHLYVRLHKVGIHIRKRCFPGSHLEEE